jgi:hypothetical protein
LVSESKKVHAADLTAVATSLQKQVTDDFGPIWSVQASVAAFERRQDIPDDYWPITIRDDLDRPEAAGYHEDELGQPGALVRWTGDWSVTASHEMLEMLADPWGRHLVAGPSPNHPGERVRFLVEVCDPCSNSCYKINGIGVSDFYTPRFFDRTAEPGVRYSYRRTIKEPREVLEGGYLTWYAPASRTWWHRSWFKGAKPIDAEIPTPAIVQGNIRAAIDRHVKSRADAKRT